MSRHKAEPPNPWKICATWNRRHPTPTRVVVRNRGEAYEAVTRSEAKVIGDKCPMIWLEGQPGGVRLAIVKPKGGDLVALFLRYLLNRR